MYLNNDTPFDVNFTGGLDRVGHELIIVAAKGTFDFPDESGGPLEFSKDQIPLFMADEFGPDPAHDAPIFENDFAPFKAKCDVLCHGPAIATGSHPVTELNVGVRVGNWSKAFSVHGSRIWIRSGVGHRISDKRPFNSQNISYDLAYGGSDPDPARPEHVATFEPNPAGVGYYPNRTELEGLPLPVTAELGKIVDNATGHHKPMAFGPLGRTWLERRKYAGTYDSDWLEERMPLMPDDFDDRYFQAAPSDQQIAFPKGGTPVELVNLTIEGRIRFHLPQINVVVTFKRKAGPVSQKIANLDTLLFLTKERKLCLTWRSRMRMDRDIFEMAEILIRQTSEFKTETPR